MALNSFFLLFFIAILHQTSCTGNQTKDDVPVVTVNQGLIKGIKEKSISGKEFYSYMSIPFAEPPAGKLRFKDPVPSKSWDGTVDGTKMPVVCMQPSIFDVMSTKRTSITLNGKEDCLYLNVYTDVPNQPEKKRPVMVFIHGGAFVVGGAQEYLPNVLMNRDIIYVVIQYRLGIFGFLSTDDPVMPGNMGLKDQQLALKWIKDNIAAFGGDPELIAIFGESAGAGAVHYQVLSPGSKGLFKRAIMQSGTALCSWASNINHRKFAIDAGKQFNCSIDLGTDSYLKCMQDVNALYLLIVSLSKRESWGMGPLYVLPRIDGDFIPDAPETLMKEGKYNKVDIISGITRDEGGLELSLSHIDPSRTETLNKNFEKYGPYSVWIHEEENATSLARSIYQHYLQRENTTVSDADRQNRVKLHTDAYFRICHDRTSNLFASNNDTNVYMYQLDHFGQSSFLELIPGFNRTDLITHGDDLAYLFEGGMFFSKPMKNEEDLKLREIMLSMWVNFAKTGNPNIADSGFSWDKATTDSFRYLSLTPNPQMKDDTFGEDRKFWSSLNTRQNLNLQRTESKEQTVKKPELVR